MARHFALPESITKEALGTWIKQSAKETFTHEKKEYFTEEEISEMESESTKLGREIIKLSDLKKSVTDWLTKGNEEEEIEVPIPVTRGLKTLKNTREELDRKVEKGYEVTETKVYGIPHEDGQMFYFDIEGMLIEERTRSLSHRERREYFGMFVTGEFGKAANQ